MRWVAAPPGWIVLACWVALSCAGLATPAAAQDWTISLDVMTENGGKFRTKTSDSNGNKQDADIEIQATKGAMVSLTTPFRVGFGFENYTLKLLPVPGMDIVLDFNVQMLDAFVDIPATRWFTVTPGVGWGKGEFQLEDPKLVPDYHAPEPVNLWQFFLVLGIHLPWDLQVRVGYHEARGTIVNRNRTSTMANTDSQEMFASVTTLGIGWSF